MKKKVAIIGAGVSGLAAAKAFKEVGHDIKVFERSHDLGGVWEPSRSYPGIQTQSPKDQYRYTDKAMPADFPEWPRGRQVHQYLSDYANDHDLHEHMNFGCEILSMQRRPDEQPGWSLDISRNQAPAKVEQFDFIAAATGQFSSKNKPEFPGQDQFESQGGQVLHSSEYTSSDIVKGKDLIVLGFSKSATDIAVNAANNGANSVTMVYRRPVWRVPYFIGGVINFKRIFYARRLERLFQSWELSRTDKLKYAIAAPFIWANWRALEALLTVQLKLKQTGQRPTEKIEDVANCSIPLVTAGFYDMLADGRIKAVQGAFQSYDTGQIMLTNGEHAKADIAVLATGWNLGVPYLPQSFQNKLIEDDGQYLLYRLIANPDLPDMGLSVSIHHSARC